MSTYQFLQVTYSDRTQWITFLSHTLKAGLIAELDSAVVDGPERIVFTGRDGYFAAGADIAELNAMRPARALEYSKRAQAVFERFSRISAVTIAAIDGYCLGGGLDLALACDLRTATPRSTFAHPGGRIGIMTGWGGSQRLRQIVGRSMALEMMVGGRWLNAQEALDAGLIGKIAEEPLRDLRLE